MPYVERFIQSLQQECLDHFVVFGKAHFDHLCSEYRTHYELERPHQGRANELIVTANHGKRSSQEPETIRLGEIHRKDRLGDYSSATVPKLLSRILSGCNRRDNGERVYRSAHTVGMLQKTWQESAN